MSVLIDNKGVGIRYAILETFDAGISLLGFEVKSIRTGKTDLRGSIVKVSHNEAFLSGAHISPYQSANTPKGYLPRRPRRLLLKKSELKNLLGKVSQRGLTLIPLSLYTKGSWIKVKFALVKPLKKRDKREKIKEREFKRRRAKLEGRSV